jgi:hypothetical protein
VNIEDRFKSEVVGKTRIITLLDNLKHFDDRAFDELAALFRARDPYLFSNDEAMEYIAKGIEQKKFSSGRTKVSQGLKNIAIIYVIEAIKEGYGLHLSDTNTGAFEQAATMMLEQNGISLTKDKVRNYWEDRENSDLWPIMEKFIVAINKE